MEPGTRNWGDATKKSDPLPLPHLPALHLLPHQSPGPRSGETRSRDTDSDRGWDGKRATDRKQRARQMKRKSEAGRGRKGCFKVQEGRS